MLQDATKLASQGSCKRSCSPGSEKHGLGSPLTDEFFLENKFFLEDEFFDANEGTPTSGEIVGSDSGGVLMLDCQIQGRMLPNKERTK